MQWLELQLDWLPAWLTSLIVLAGGGAAGLAVCEAGSRLITHALARRDEFWRSLIARTKGPARLALLVIGLSIGASLAPLDPGQAALIQHALLICFILLVGWIGLVAMNIASAIYLRRFANSASDNFLARKHVTQVRLLQRACATLIVLLTASLALMTIPGVRQYGVSLLASAGAAGVIFGLALQPVLGNLIAGVQIAMTQPIRIGDAVIVENEWGEIEEITSTYVVVRVWDWRRMVLPLSYFIQKPFQNWTRESASLIGTSMLYLDYSAPVEIMRRKLEEIVAGSRLWDKQVVNLAVTDLKERTMEVRCLVSAKNAGETFDLRCEVREKMIAFLQAEHPYALPRQRLDLPEGAAVRIADGGAPRPQNAGEPARYS